jgi:hypothetical protein
MQAEFTILVRLRNASNQVVDKMSQSYVLTGRSTNSKV